MWIIRIKEKFRNEYRNGENRRDKYELESDNEYEDECDRTDAEEETLEPKKKKLDSKTFFSKRDRWYTKTFV